MVSQKMTRLFHLADFMLTNSLEAMSNPQEFSLAFFEHFTSSLTFYIKELNQLVTAGTESHFLMIANKVQHLQKHLGELDRVKVRAAMKNGDNVDSRSLNKDCDNNFQLANNSILPSFSASSLLPPADKIDMVVPFDGDILNWLNFAATFRQAIKTINDPDELYRLLYNNLDNATRERFLSEVNPLKPDIPTFFGRLCSYYEGNPEQTFSLTKVSLGKLPLLKNRYSSASWLALMKAANQAKVLLALHIYKDNGKIVGYESALVSVLVHKLPPRFQNLFNDGLLHGQQKPNLTIFASFCDQQLKVISERQAEGLLSSTSPKEGDLAEVPERLCPICEGDYHLAEQCEFDLAVRMEAVAAKELCRLCLQQWLPAEFESGHKCPNKHKRCVQCGDADHHVALCPTNEIFMFN